MASDRNPQTHETFGPEAGETSWDSFPRIVNTSELPHHPYSRHLIPTGLRRMDPHHHVPDMGLASSTVVLGDGPFVTIPDFSGWAVRRVAKECEKLGSTLMLWGAAWRRNKTRSRV